MSRKQRYWAQTTLLHFDVAIRLIRGKAECDGFVDFYPDDKLFVILISEHIAVNKALLAHTLMHELVHVVEYFHGEKPSAFSIRKRKQCTALAQNMGAAMSELVMNLRLVEADDPVRLPFGGNHRGK